MMHTRRRARVSRIVVSLLLVASAALPLAARAPEPLTPLDLWLLQRVTFGLDSATLARFRALGRDRFLDEQLAPPDADPPALAAAIAPLSIVQQSTEDRLRTLRAERRRIDGKSDVESRQARRAVARDRSRVIDETATRHLMRALASPAQLREQMTWFWMNHFSVFARKGRVAWLLPDYEERAIRPHVLGRFRDLVLATVTAPAMLEYLDNVQSAAGRLNENYARELMELHTLGVSGGPSGSKYSQRDVQELARILTGAGIDASETTRRAAGRRQPHRIDRGAFAFRPARHDFGAKTLLGHAVAGRGFEEVEQAVTILCREPAAARFITRKLAIHFVADDPPAALLEAMAATFRRTEGDIAAVLRTMFLSPDFTAVLDSRSTGGGKFKDPIQFVVSSLRLASDGAPIANFAPVMRWLRELGQPLYGRVTPDGYSLLETGWASPGQMVTRFEIARAIGSGAARLFESSGARPRPERRFPSLDGELFQKTIAPTLSAQTRDALSRTTSPHEWNTVLLASPDWMLR